MSVVLIKLHDVIKMTSLSRSSLYAFIKNGEFPHQIRIGKRAVAWSKLQVEDWVNQRIQQSAIQ